MTKINIENITTVSKALATFIKNNFDPTLSDDRVNQFMSIVWNCKLIQESLTRVIKDNIVDPEEELYLFIDNRFNLRLGVRWYSAPLRREISYIIKESTMEENEE